MTKKELMSVRIELTDSIIQYQKAHQSHNKTLFKLLIKRRNMEKLHCKEHWEAYQESIVRCRKIMRQLKREMKFMAGLLTKLYRRK